MAPVLTQSGAVWRTLGRTLVRSWCEGTILARSLVSLRHLCGRSVAPKEQRKSAQNDRVFAPYCIAQWLTKTSADAYIPFLRRAAAFARWRVVKPLTVHTV